jgi:hypothetical protein
MCVLVLIGIQQQYRAYVDEPQRGIVCPARELPAAEVQQVAAGVQECMQLFEAAEDERADVRHRAVLPDKAREETDDAVAPDIVDYVDFVDTHDKI